MDVTEENSGAKSSKQKRKKRVIRYQINAQDKEMAKAIDSQLRSLQVVSPTAVN